MTKTNPHRAHFLVDENNATIPNKAFHLEGLRGLLAVIVVIHHFVLLFYPETYLGSFDLNYFATNSSSFKILLAHSPLNFFMNGHFAVCIFLVVSGYVLTWSYKESNNFEIIQQHAIKRYFRLVLPVLGACLFIKLLFVTGTIEAARYPRNVKELSFGAKEFGNSLNLLKILKISFFSVPLDGDSSFLSVLWTIRVEFLGALCVFALLFLSHNRDRKIFYAVIFTWGLVYFSHHYLAVLLAGSTICIYEDQVRKILKHLSGKIVLFGLGIFLGGIVDIKATIPYTMYAFTQNLPFNAYYYFHDLGAILVFIGFISSIKLRRIFSFSPMVRFGKLSFSIYLIHLPILYCIGSRLMWMTHGKIHPLILFSSCFLSTLLVSIIFYKLVDKPAILFSNRMAKKIMGKDFKSKREKTQITQIAERG